MSEHPHDKFFKALFSNKQMMMEYISQFLPPSIVDNLLLDSLTLQKVSHVDDKLKESFSDIIYTGIFKESQRQLDICLLLEHKSFPSKYIQLQLLRYMLNAWEKQLGQKEELRLIIPIVFYHGKQKWNTQPIDQYFGQIDPSFKAFIPSFDYILTDLKNYSDEQILNLKASFLINSFLVLKHAWEKNYLKQYIDLLIEPKGAIDSSLRRKFFVYFRRIIQLTGEEIELLMENVSSNTKKEFLSLHDWTLQKGRAEGRAEKLNENIKGLLTNGVSIELIAKSLKVSEEFVLSIKKGLKLD